MGNEYVQQLAASKAELVSLQRLLSQSSLMTQTEQQTFIFDLRDYTDSLALVTDFVETTPGTEKDPQKISALLGEQNQLLQQLIQEIDQLLAVDGTFFDQKDGELRRTLGSLQGVLELNGLLLQDNLKFQRVLNEQPLEFSTVAPLTKPGFFQRLFGKK